MRAPHIYSVNRCLVKLCAQLWVSMGLLLTLCACAPSRVTPPPKAQDAPPQITVGYADATGLGPTPPTQLSYTRETTTTTIDMPTKATSHVIALFASAHNPGGVQSLRLSLNNVDVATLVVAPDANGQVPPTIGIVGSDGAGGPGDQQIAFANVGANVVTATAVNFNGEQSHITITFVAHVPPLP
jgi:hypothetical protein